MAAAPSSGAARRVTPAPLRNDPGRSPQPTPLEVVPSRRSARGRIVKFLPVVMVVVALLIVVGGQAMLANGQVRMARLDQRLQIAQSEHRQEVLNVAERETPSRIAGAATAQLHMVHPAHVTQLPVRFAAYATARPERDPEERRCDDHIDRGAMSVTTRHTTGRARTVPDRGGAQTSARPHTGRRVRDGTPGSGAEKGGPPSGQAHRVRTTPAPAPPAPAPVRGPHPRARGTCQVSRSSDESGWYGSCWSWPSCSWSPAWSTCRSSTRAPTKPMRATNRTIRPR